MSKKSVLLSCLIVCLCASSCWAQQLKMAVFPRRSAPQTMKMFKPLAAAMSKELGVEVKLVLSKDFPTFWKGVKGKQYDIVHFSPSHFLPAQKNFGYSALVQNVEFGRESLSAVIYARKDSGISTAADLKGKKVVFGGGKKSFFAYIAPTYILRKAGLQKGDYQEQIAKNPFNAVMAAYTKAGDAGCASDITLEMPPMKKKVKAEELQAVGQVGPLPQLLWATGERVDADLKGKLEAFFLGLKAKPQGPALLKGAKISNFTKVGDYSLVKEVVEVATGEKY